jgi:hypothetical protein
VAADTLVATDALVAAGALVATDAPAAQKRKAGRFHPAKSSQDPHSIEAFWAFNRSGTLG